MAKVLLTNEQRVKQNTALSDNIYGKFLLPSIDTAQEIRLRGIIGEALLNKLKDIVAKKTVDAPEHKAYKDLLDNDDFCKFIDFSAAVEATIMASYKVGNFGVAKSTDENLAVASFDEITKQQFFYQSKADAYCHYLQEFLKAHGADYPELVECCHVNLDSSATTGIFLGGARGKDLRR